MNSSGVIRVEEALEQTHPRPRDLTDPGLRFVATPLPKQWLDHTKGLDFWKRKSSCTPCNT